MGRAIGVVIYRQRNGKVEELFHQTADSFLVSARLSRDAEAPLDVSGWDVSMVTRAAAFYQYHASLMEPWDGPASMTFTDGTAVLMMIPEAGSATSRWSPARRRFTSITPR